MDYQSILRSPESQGRIQYHIFSEIQVFLIFLNGLFFQDRSSPVLLTENRTVFCKLQDPVQKVLIVSTCNPEN